MTGKANVVLFVAALGIASIGIATWDLIWIKKKGCKIIEDDTNNTKKEMELNAREAVIEVEEKERSMS